MTKRKEKTPRIGPADAACYQIKITLEEIEPPIWRRLIVPADLPLDVLHGVLQGVMGWTDFHMHQFHVGKARYGKQSLLDDDGCDERDEAGITVEDIARRTGAFFYEYDFGDDWMHRIEFEEAPNPQGAMAHPVCTGGARACPPEDCGGPWGYQNFLDAVLDPRHEEHDSWLEWIGGSFDPEAFDMAAVNAFLKRVVRGRRDVSTAPKAQKTRRAKGAQPASMTAVSATLPFSEEAVSPEDPLAPSPIADEREPHNQPPTLEEWRRLHAAAAVFKEAGAWGWMAEKDLFGVQNPEDGHTGYCCVMGALGQYHALAVYRGAAGLASWRRIQTEGRKKRVDTEIFFGQDCLMVSWENRSDLDSLNLSTLRTLGLKFRGSHAWPLFRDYAPGYYPWHLTGNQARFLACALEQARDVALRFLKDPKTLAPKGDRLLVRVPKDALGQGAWEDRWIPAEPAPLPPSVSEPLDEVRLKRIGQKCERVDGVWQADRFHIFAPVGGEDRPFYPALFLALDAATNLVVGQGMDHPCDGLAPLRAHLLEAMETSGAIPGELWVQRAEVFECLRPLAERLGIGLRQKKGLRKLDAARKDLEQVFGAR